MKCWQHTHQPKKRININNEPSWKPNISRNIIISFHWHMQQKPERDINIITSGRDEDFVNWNWTEKNWATICFLGFTYRVRKATKTASVKLMSQLRFEPVSPTQISDILMQVCRLNDYVIVWDLRFSHQWLWRLLSSGMQPHIGWWPFINVSERTTGSIFWRKMEAVGSHKTLVNNYQSTWCQMI